MTIEGPIITLKTAKCYAESVGHGLIYRNLDRTYGTAPTSQHVLPAGARVVATLATVAGRGVDGAWNWVSA